MNNNVRDVPELENGHMIFDETPNTDVNADNADKETAATAPPHPNCDCDCTSKHCNGPDEFGDKMPDFVDYPAGAAPFGEEDIDEEALAAHIKRRRLGGWTAQTMRLFLLRLADTGNVHQCCREFGLSRQSAYALRRRNEVSRRAWDGAKVRSRDSLLDEAWGRAYHGAHEQVVVNGKIVERQSKPDGAMLRYLLSRADRLANDGANAARPAQQAELHLEELLDCIDPDGADPEEEKPDEDALIADIAASAEWNWGQPKATEPSGPMDFASDAEAIGALIAHKKLMTTKPEDVDTSDLDPAECDSWTDEQWARADRSGLTEQIDWDEEDEAA